MIHITILTKSGGVLTKRISIRPDGSLNSDGSACVMSAGEAQRATFADLASFAAHIASLQSHEAIALGALRDDLPDKVEITTKARLNGAAAPHLIARTAEHIVYRAGRIALLLIDFDTKGMPAAVRRRLDELGGIWPALVSVLPELATVGTVFRSSTSAGLFRTDTGAHLAGSSGVHVYVLVVDGSDAERFLRRLHERCWLAGLGWLMVGAAGQLLDRSLVDRMVYAGERLVFEGAPLLGPPLAQDQAARAPVVSDGPALDTRLACPDLTPAEQARLRQFRAAEGHRLAPDADRERGRHIEAVARRTGCTLDAARQAVERQCAGVLLPGVVLAFDDDGLGAATVGDVLANPARYVGETLADPVEGIEYGRCKAKVMQRADGSLWIHSFAHGRATYDLRHDAATIEAALRAAVPTDVANIFVRLLLVAEVAADEEQHLRGLVCDLAGIKPRPLAAKIKAARAEQAKRQAQAERNRRAAERTDPRVQILAPLPDAPWLPAMAVINDVLGASAEHEPPMRDIDGVLCVVRARRVASMHALTAGGANQEEDAKARLPSPEEPLITRLDDAQAAELIEHHIDYVDAGGRSVHLPAAFVRHFRRRSDNILPVVSSVATLPLVLPDGTLLSGRGLDRRRGIVFRVPDQLEAVLPHEADCTDAAVAGAMRFLADDFLADVATDYAGKCGLIALALSIIERAALPERPAFIISAGQRGTGKTTVLSMISQAVLGRRAAAAAWSPNEEERRKALFAYLAEGVAFLVWDNIPRGSAISCPSIEKALTAETYSDRVLGVTEFRTVLAHTIQAFTGNNVGARGDLASRSLTTRLSVDRTDPENRTFTHPDPLAWIEANRGEILRALYIIALGNPRLRGQNAPPAETRFKMWWHIIGSAVEHAAYLHDATAFPGDANWNPTCPPRQISFRDLFLDGEADDEQSSSLATVLDVLRTRWPNGCQANEVAAYAGGADEGSIEFKAALEAASGKAIKIVTATIITWRLKALVDAPVQRGDAVLVLRYLPDDHGGVFRVVAIR
jgi:hypothetical protein